MRSKKVVDIMSLQGKFEAIQRVIKWIPKIWKSYNFDAYYLLELEVEKLKDMRKCFEDGCASSSLDNSKQMEELIGVGQWLLDNHTDWKSDEELEAYKIKLRYFYNTIAERFVYWWD